MRKSKVIPSNSTKKTLQPPQQQSKQPGEESEMVPKPVAENTEIKGSGKLKNKVAIITGGDSGIGRAVAIAFAKEGANIVITYLDEHKDAEETKRHIENHGQNCMIISGDVQHEKICQWSIDLAIEKMGRLDILVNNAAIQYRCESIENISAVQLENVFRTNIFSYFFMSKFALPHLKQEGSIINTTSVTAYKGNPHLIDYSSTKGAIVSFTRSLALSLVERRIRVNAVAPGPVWTPLIPASLTATEVANFGDQVPMKRPAQPAEIAFSYVFLASAESSFMTGQVLHPNGGVIVNG